MATFTMLTSSTDMNIPPINTASGMRQAIGGCDLGGLGWSIG
jgi:hypothetical protein